MADGIVGDIIPIISYPQPAASVVANGAVVHVDGGVGGIYRVIETPPPGILNSDILQGRAAQIISLAVEGGVHRRIAKDDACPVVRLALRVPGGESDGLSGGTAGDERALYLQGAGVAEPDGDARLQRQRHALTHQHVAGDQVGAVGDGPGGVAAEDAAHLGIVRLVPGERDRLQSGRGGGDGGGEPGFPLQVAGGRQAAQIGGGLGAAAPNEILPADNAPQLAAGWFT